MSVTVLRGFHAVPRRVRQAPKGWIAEALATLREWRRRARGRSELGRLDDRMLADIGISRAEAHYLSRVPFWKE